MARACGGGVHRFEPGATSTEEVLVFLQDKVSSVHYSAEVGAGLFALALARFHAPACVRFHALDASI